MIDFFVHASYLAAAAMFVSGIKKMSRVRTAKVGNRQAGIGMLVAIVATLVALGTVNYTWIIAGLVVGGAVGAICAKRVEMTAMPELVALFNGLGGAASLFVALAYLAAQKMPDLGDESPSLSALISEPSAIAIVLSILIGAVTLTGSLVAYGKLSGKLKGAPVILPQRHAITAGLFVALLLVGLLACFVTTSFAATLTLFVIVTLISLALGVLLVIPIGGADMPVVISLLNSYSGIAASMTGFILLGSTRKAESMGALMLIICGALVGAAGIILTNIMCKAMNRSLLSVLTGGFGDTGSSGGGDQSEYQNVKSGSAEEAAMLLDGARKVIIVPGYGLAVAQAQHAIAELEKLLEAQGTEVRYAIHPVAGRMPGHMNVLLAEANVGYEKLVEMDDINSDFKNTDVSIIVGANDVVNPAAINDPESPIAGMPILNSHESQNVIVIKRSLSPGYAGIKNSLFEYPNTMMVFADAKAAIQDFIKELKDL